MQLNVVYILENTQNIINQFVAFSHNLFLFPLSEFKGYLFPR